MIKWLSRKKDKEFEWETYHIPFVCPCGCGKKYKKCCWEKDRDSD